MLPVPRASGSGGLPGWCPGKVCSLRQGYDRRAGRPRSSLEVREYRRGTLAVRGHQAVSCGVHFDVDHQQFTFSVGDHTVTIEQQPTKTQLRSIAENLPS